MRNLITAILLIGVVACMGAITYTDNVTFLGTDGGVNYYDLSGAVAPSGWTDTNSYTIFHNMHTNSAGALADISGNSRNMAALPSVASGGAQFMVTNNPAKVAMLLDGVDDHFDLSTLTGMTNASQSTIHIWRRRQDRPVDLGANEGESLLKYCVKGSATYHQISLSELALFTVDGKTNCYALQAYSGSTPLWSCHTDNNTVNITDEWQLLTVAHNGTTALVWLDGIAQTVFYSYSADTTYWKNMATASDTIALGTWWYNNTAYYNYDGDVALYAELDYLQTSNQVYEFWQNTNPTNYLRIE